MPKLQLALFPLLAAAALWLWAGPAFADGPLAGAARLCGVLGALGVMGQMLAMCGAPWLAPLTAGRPPVKWHHRAGLLLPLLLLAHPPLIALHHARQYGVSFAGQYRALLSWDGVPLAAAGEFLLIAAALLSLEPLRRRLSYAAWRRFHLGVYAGLALALPHQFALGSGLAGGGSRFTWAWYGLLAFTAACALWYRLLRPRLGPAA